MINSIIVHLGLNITSSKNLPKEIKTYAQKAARLADYLNEIFWRNKYMRKETKSKNTYKAILRSIMTYALETRAET